MSGPSLSLAICVREVYAAEVEAHITGTVWKIECAVGDTIEEGDTVAILESMKMEMPVEAEDGMVAEIRCEEGQAVNEGDTLVVLEKPWRGSAGRLARARPVGTWAAALDEPVPDVCERFPTRARRRQAAHR